MILSQFKPSLMKGCFGLLLVSSLPNTAMCFWLLDVSTYSHITSGWIFLFIYFCFFWLVQLLIIQWKEMQCWQKRGDKSVWPEVGKKGRTVPAPAQMGFNCSGVVSETVRVYCCFFSCWRGRSSSRCEVLTPLKTHVGVNLAFCLFVCLLEGWF